MGQKINPIGFRLKTQQRCSIWYENFKAYSFALKEDNQILTFFKNKMDKWAINKIKIKREVNRKIVTIHIHTKYPHLILNSKNLKVILQIKQKILLKLFKIENSLTKINLLALIIADQIQERISFQRIMQIILLKLENTTFRGIKIQISGRLNGIEKAKTEWYRKGSIPLNTIVAQIEYTQKTVITKYGSIGLKIWLINS